MTNDVNCMVVAKFGTIVWYLSFEYIYDRWITVQNEKKQYIYIYINLV